MQAEHKPTNFSLLEVHKEEDESCTSYEPDSVERWNTNFRNVGARRSVEEHVQRVTRKLRECEQPMTAGGRDAYKENGQF